MPGTCRHFKERNTWTNQHRRSVKSVREFILHVAVDWYRAVGKALRIVFKKRPTPTSYKPTRQEVESFWVSAMKSEWFKKSKTESSGTVDQTRFGSRHTLLGLLSHTPWNCKPHPLRRQAALPDPICSYIKLFTVSIHITSFLTKWDHTRGSLCVCIFKRSNFW